MSESEESACYALAAWLLRNPSEASFMDWRNIFFRSEQGSQEAAVAVQQMAARAATFGHWLTMFQIVGPEDSLYGQAENQLSLLADNPTDGDLHKKKSVYAIRAARWKTIFEVADAGSPLEQRAIDRMVAFLRVEKQASAGIPNQALASKI